MDIGSGIAVHWPSDVVACKGTVRRLEIFLASPLKRNDKPVNILPWNVEGTLNSIDPASGMVTVIVDGRPLAFPQDKLSEGDRDFLKESRATVSETPVSSAAAATSVVGAIVAKAKLQQLDGKRFKKAESVKSPDYYVLYYSAPW